MTIRCFLFSPYLCLCSVRHLYPVSFDIPCSFCRFRWIYPEAVSVHRIDLSLHSCLARLGQLEISFYFSLFRVGLVPCSCKSTFLLYQTLVVASRFRPLSLLDMNNLDGYSTINLIQTEHTNATLDRNK
jgi:hypothetical protein